ncbi:MAG: glycoside hydrolase family 2 TIM barrel-domain containing protein [Verrucomicrobiae bacterium]|nr:glycoside hydrolase family 2 TIM barrel-domain containing protein [Verrucomicrobiae bacterium]
MKLPGLFAVCAGLALFACLAASTASAWQLQTAPIVTSWAQLVDTNNPLPEYPRPQMVRTNWLSLNGLWQFQAGATNDPVPTNQTLAGDILVPYPMESALSGVAEYHLFSWYRRTFTVPPAWSGQRILLHFDAVDWQSQVYLNGQSVGIHKGGYDAFTYDVTPYLTGSGPQELIVRVYNAVDFAGEPRGKQTLFQGGIMYTSSTGIWQPVWLEPVPATSISDIKLIPDVDNSRLNISVAISGPTNGVIVNAIARSGGILINTIAGAPGLTNFALPIPSPNLWSPTNPFLYDLTVTLSNATSTIDSVGSYFGMRKISLATNGNQIKILLNNQFVFEFGPLDQGFWPDGLYTAPTDDALKSDIEQEKALGFNMVRKHIKVERQRWYYWADKLGILVWQDMPSVNSYTGTPQTIDTNQFETELVRLVQNHWNHPAIIMWVVFNESQGQHDTTLLVPEVKALDPSRLVNQASGGDYFGVGDIYDNHSYPDPGAPTSTTQANVDGEFGGIGLGITNHTWAAGWGYVAAANGDDQAAKFEVFCGELAGDVQNTGLNAAVYTEITDVETELNGLYTYDRAVRKPDLRRMQAAILSASVPPVMTTVVPTSQSGGLTWQYVTSAPAANWYTTGFDASAWSSGSAGFGAGDPPNTSGLVRTAWNNSDIWLRRTVNPGALTTQQISNLVFSVYHDEDVEIYVNGVLAASASGYTTAYTYLALNAAGQAALIPNASNLLAVHCHQTGGGQYIDVGLSVRSNATAALPSPPAVPANVILGAGQYGVSVGWSTVTNAATYNLKRSTVSGGPYTNVVVAPMNAGTDNTVTNRTTYYYVVSAVNAAGESANSAEVSVTTAPPVVPPLPQLTTWFKADAITGLVNGAAVSLWPDASGQGDNATQTTAGQMPKYVTGAINGLPVVRFNSTNQTSLAFPRTISGDFTLICVFRSTQGLNTGTLYFQGAGLVSGEVSGVVNDFGTCLFADGTLCAGTGNPDVAVNSGPGFNNGAPHIFTFTRKRATGGIALYVDGALAGTTTGSTASLTAPSALVLGAQQTLQYYLNGDIAEVKIYNAALADADRLTDEGSLRCKYNLGSGVLPPAPGGLLAAAGNRRVQLSWNPVVGANSYNVFSATNSAGPFTACAGVLTTTNFTDLNASNGVTNYYQVVAVSSCGAGARSPTAAVLLPLPMLGVNFTGGSLNLNWPAWADDWKLYKATNLMPPIAWQLVTNVATGTNGSFMLGLPQSTTAQFYRLTSP